MKLRPIPDHQHFRRMLQWQSAKRSFAARVKSKADMNQHHLRYVPSKRDLERALFSTSVGRLLFLPLCSPTLLRTLREISRCQK